VSGDRKEQPLGQVKITLYGPAEFVQPKLEDRRAIEKLLNTLATQLDEQLSRPNAVPQGFRVTARWSSLMDD
jgi:hypothetical protein